MTNTGGDWGDCQTKKFYEPFTQNTGIKIVPGPFLNDGQIQGMVRARNITQDVVYPSPDMAVGDSGRNNLEPIDYSNVPKDQLVPGTYTDYAVSIDLFSWVLGYRKDKLPAGPTSWADFFDTAKFPGKRALPGDIDVPAILYAALLADGVAPDKMQPIDVDRALKKLDQIKPNVVWYGSGSQGQDLLKTGEVSMAMLYGNRVVSLRDAGTPVDMSWNGHILVGDLVGVPKGNTNVKAAMDLIAFIVSKDINGTFSSCAAGAPANKEATADPKVAKDLSTAHLNEPHVTTTEPKLAEYVATHKDEITTKFNNWRAK